MLKTVIRNKKRGEYDWRSVPKRVFKPCSIHTDLR
jgi:hypothetical protein